MRLRLGCHVQDLAYRLNFSKTFISKFFLSNVDLLNAKLSFLIKWSSRKELHRTMPLSFREHFGKEIAVIIDSFEIFIERSSGLKVHMTSFFFR